MTKEMFLLIIIGASNMGFALYSSLADHPVDAGIALAIGVMDILVIINSIVKEARE